MHADQNATAVEPASAIIPAPSDQRRHFDEHGWILLPGVLDRAQVERYRGCIDRAVAGPFASDCGGGKVRCDQLILKDSAFVDFITIPRILQTYSDIAGCAAVLKNAWSF